MKSPYRVMKKKLFQKREQKVHSGRGGAHCAGRHKWAHKFSLTLPRHFLCPPPFMKVTCVIICILTPIMTSGYLNYH